jgi:hypothetical protein
MVPYTPNFKWNDKYSFDFTYWVVFAIGSDVFIASSVPIRANSIEIFV